VRRGKLYKGRLFRLESVEAPSWQRSDSFSPCSTAQSHVRRSPNQRRPNPLYLTRSLRGNTEQSPQTQPPPLPTKLYIVARLYLYLSLTLLRLTALPRRSRQSSTKHLLLPKRRPRNIYSIVLYRMSPVCCHASRAFWQPVVSTSTRWSSAVQKCQT
jgi:hypothetical protein